MSPLIEPHDASPQQTLATVTGAAEQALWNSTLDEMTQQPGADLHALGRIRAWITNGVTLDLASTPGCVFHENTFSVIQHADTVRTRLREYIDFGAVIPLPSDHPLPFGIQPLHVIIKPEKKPRLVIDLSRNLNDHLEYEYFSYSSVREAVERSTPGCWYCKLDLTNCFLSFPLHPSARPHFIIEFEGRLYQFMRMPFGLSSAPRICTMLLSVVAFRLARLGVSEHLRFLDDFLLMKREEHTALAARLTAQGVFRAFGLVVNAGKTEGPAQRLAFLGILLDSVKQTLECTPERVIELRTLLRSARDSRYILLSQLSTLIGKLQFAAQVLSGARPFTKRLIDARTERTAAVTRAHSGNAQLFALRHTRVFTRSFRADIKFWLAHLHQWNGTQRWRSAQATPFVFASDASLTGFGFYIESTPPSTASAQWPIHLRVGSGFSGTWSPSDISRVAASEHDVMASGHMTWCEMFAVYAVLHTYRAVLRDCCTLFMLDNESDVYVLNRQRTRARRLAGLLREIYTIAVEQNISIYARHRPGVDNVLADFLSRPEKHGSIDIVASWAAAYPSMSSRLSVVTHVCSEQIGSAHARPSSTSSTPSR